MVEDDEQSSSSEFYRAMPYIRGQAKYLFENVDKNETKWVWCVSLFNWAGLCIKIGFAKVFRSGLIGLNKLAGNYLNWATY